MKTRRLVLLAASLSAALGMVAPPAAGADLTVNQPDPRPGFDAARVGIPRGKVTPFEYESKTTGERFRATIHTPPGFSRLRKYPVLYLLHGASGDENDWVQTMRADTILDNLYAERKVVPMLVVMPSALSSAARERAGGDRDAKARAAMAFGGVLVRDLIPFVEANFPAKPGREHRALAGLSMGGGVALSTGLGNSEHFAWVGAFSGAGRRWTEPAQKLRLLWLSVGDQDRRMAGAMASADAFYTERKIPHLFRINTGGHEPKVWKNDLHYFAQLLFRPDIPAAR